MEHYSHKFKIPEYPLVSPLFTLEPWVPPLVEYLKISVNSVLTLDAQDILYTLDLVYSRLLNEQRYHDHLSKKTPRLRR